MADQLHFNIRDFRDILLAEIAKLEHGVRETIVNNGGKISLTEGKIYQVKVHWNLVKRLKALLGFCNNFLLRLFMGHRFKKRTTAYDTLYK